MYRSISWTKSKAATEPKTVLVLEFGGERNHGRAIERKEVRSSNGPEDRICIVLPVANIPRSVVAIDSWRSGRRRLRNQTTGEVDNTISSAA